VSRKFAEVVVKLDKIVGGGQALGVLEDGKKLFVWGGLPDEEVEVQITKNKSKLAEGMVTKVIKPSQSRIGPQDPESYLSTSPWQIMDFDAEQHYKAALIEEAFELHNIVLPNPIEVCTNNQQYEYRNKVEFSWWFSKETDTLDLAFFKRGTNGKIPVEKTSLARPEINQAAIAIRDTLRDRENIRASDLKTLLIRCDQKGEVVAQLYVKDKDFKGFSPQEMQKLSDMTGIEIIYSNPKSPASVITKRLWSMGKTNLIDVILGKEFTYAVEGFFQVNIPVYEEALKDMKRWTLSSKPTLDLYSGVGTIGLTIGTPGTTLVESNEHAFNEMENNISNMKSDATAILTTSEKADECITSDKVIIVDPPRAGLHENVIERLLDQTPDRIIYLSCNPVTQARDVMMLSKKYGVKYHKGYNFFPRTPHIEHLVILDIKK
jgi:23S rRNA (uracil1939-C5)-methyltransferase